MSHKIISINRTMQKGYKFYEKNSTEECLKIWLETWKLVKEVFSENNIELICSFDETYSLTQYVSNWVMDFQEVLQNSNNYELHNNFCNWLIPLYDKNESNICVIKIDLARSYFDMGNKDKGETHFQALTAEYPEYGWGWINWSRQYWFFGSTDTDYKKGEEILLEALKVNNIEDKEDIYETLFDLYQGSGQIEKSKSIEKNVNSMTSDRMKQSINLQSGEKALREENFQENVPYGFGAFDNEVQSEKNKTKIGRNDPCICGSGKKYKKCCG